MAKKAKVAAKTVKKTKAIVSKKKKVVHAPTKKIAPKKIKKALPKPKKIVRKSKPVAKLKAKPQAKPKKVNKPLSQTRTHAPVAKKARKAPIMAKPYIIKKDEEYMNTAQLQHFKNLLLNWKNELLQEAETTVHDMQSTSANFPDPVDRASQEEEFNLELRARDRGRKLLKKIEETLQRIRESNYGYCDDCGAEIGVRRLEVRPTATQCIECKTISEIREKQIGEIGKEKDEE